MASRMVFAGPGEGTAAPFMPGEGFLWKATGAETSGALDFSELSLAPGVTTPQHIHHANDEIFYILDGNIRFVVDGESINAFAGSFVFIPRGTSHAWVNDSSSSSRALLMFTPGGVKGYFDELEPLLPKLMPGLDDISKIDPETLRAAEDIMRRYHYELAGPPPA